MGLQECESAMMANTKYIIKVSKLKQLKQVSILIWIV